MARRTGIPRSTLRQRMHPLGTREVHTGVRKPSSEQRPEGQLPQELMEAWEDLKEMQAWWRARKRALQTTHSHQETQRQTYHVEKRYIEAITRAADAEGVSITNMGSSPSLRPSSMAHHTRLKCAFASCVHVADHMPSAGSA
jgi:hypothetical protein